MHPRPPTSVLHPADMPTLPLASASGGIVLKKFFWDDERKFLEPLMRFARGDMRDHTVSHRIDHGASYRRYGVLPRRSRLKINFSASFDFRLLQRDRG